MCVFFWGGGWGFWGVLGEVCGFLCLFILICTCTLTISTQENYDTPYLPY